MITQVTDKQAGSNALAEKTLLHLKHSSTLLVLKPNRSTHRKRDELFHGKSGTTMASSPQFTQLGILNKFSLVLANAFNGFIYHLNRLSN